MRAAFARRGGTDRHIDKDLEEDVIDIDGTIALCEDLNVNPEEVVLLCIAYELKSKKMGTWERKGWIDGWKALGCAPSCLHVRSLTTRLSDATT